MEDNTKVSDHNENASGVISEAVINSVDTEVKETVKDNRVNHASYMKVLNEKKKKDELLADAQSKIDEMEQAKLEESGQLQTLVEKLREDKRSLADKYEGEKRKRAYEKVSGQIVAKASELGCVDSEALMQLGDFSTLAPSEDGLKANETDVLFAIEEVMKKRPYLFKKSVPGVSDVTPSSKPFTSGEKKLSEMSSEEIEAKLRSL